jgi:hypothetical protein
MRLVNKALLGIGLTVAVIAIGCGGSVTEPGGGGTQGSGGSAGSGGSGGAGGGGGGSGGGDGTGGSGGSAGAPALDAGPGVCPDSPPTLGSECTAFIGPYCEYGNSPNPACNDAFKCSSGPPVWQKVPSTGTCPAPSATCPGSYPGVDNMQPKCSVDGLSCEYAQGFCVCTNDPGGLVTTGGPLWSCSSPGKDCPAKRPLLGSPCSGPGDSNEPGPVCDYGSCNGGVAEQCTGWYWKVVETACPG